MPCVRSILFLGLSSLLLSHAIAQNASPFMPTASAGASASNVPQSFEISGTITTSGGTKLCVYDVQAKQSHWIKVGESSESIKVLSYDPKTERAQVVINGESRTLELRKTSISSQPAPSYIQPTYQRTPEYSQATPSVAPARPNFTPTQLSENAKQEQESRMLVSDLLDIGMQQRKAYEEAKQKADAAAAAKGK
jgi:hypothetical protein